MVKNLYIIVVLFFQISNISYSQFIEDIKESFKSNPSFFIKYNTRNSIISTQGARINSINAGLDFAKKTRLGIGYEWLGSDIEREKYFNNDLGFLDTVNTNLRLNYISLFGEYIFYTDRKWEFSLPIIFSFGNAGYLYKKNDKKYSINRSFVFGYEAQMIGQYSILKWLGVGGGIGYRIMFKNKNKLDENFTSPIYILRLKIFFDKIKA